jgi:hypothetical protein
MNLLPLIIALCLFGNSTQRVPQAGAMNPAEVKNFCEVMATPKRLRGKVITLRASARVLDAGILLRPGQCKVPDVTVHYMAGYEEKSNAQALRLIEQLRGKAREVYLRDGNLKAARTTVDVVFEGRLEKNPYYHVKIARGAATLAAWDYSYEYAFTVTRIISVSSPE